MEEPSPRAAMSPGHQQGIRRGKLQNPGSEAPGKLWMELGKTGTSMGNNAIDVSL